MLINRYRIIYTCMSRSLSYRHNIFLYAPSVKIKLHSNELYCPDTAKKQNNYVLADVLPLHFNRLFI